MAVAAAAVVHVAGGSSPSQCQAVDAAIQEVGGSPFEGQAAAAVAAAVHVAGGFPSQCQVAVAAAVQEAGGSPCQGQAAAAVAVAALLHLPAHTLPT